MLRYHRYQAGSPNRQGSALLQCRHEIPRRQVHLRCGRTSFNLTHKSMKQLATAILIVLAFCQSLLAAPHSIIRLYTSEVPGFVSAWQKEPPAADSLWRAAGPPTVMVMDNLYPEKIAACMELLKPITTDSIPALALGPSVEDGTAGWVSRAHWEMRAGQLKAMSERFANVETLRIHFEVENFHTGDEATESVLAKYGGREALKEAMKPFLDVMGTRPNNRKWHVLTCPAAPDDVCIQLIAERCYEIWMLDEDQFGLAGEYRTKPATAFVDALCRMGNRRASILESGEKYCQRVRWIPGTFEEPFRKWGGRFVATCGNAMGPELWLYNNDKESARAGLIPGTAWTNGINRSSLNDCAYFPFGYQSKTTGWNGEAEFKTPTIDGRTIYERTGTCSTANSFAIAVTVDVPTTGARSIAANWQPDPNSGGFKEWQIRSLDGSAHFDWMESGKDGTLRLGEAKSGRYVVSWNTTAKVFTVATPSTTVTIAAPKQLASNQPLRLGVGTMPTATGRTRIYGDGLNYRDVHLRAGVFSATEIETLRKGGNYPF